MTPMTDLKPTDEQLYTAIAWLRCNEGDHGEREGCEAVAAYLEHWAFENMLRREARKAGVPVARLRRKLLEAQP